MRRSSPEEQAAWRIESQQYDEAPELTWEQMVAAGLVSEPADDGLDLAGLSDAELDVLARHANTPAIKAAATAEIERRLEIQWEQEYERMERNEAEADLDSMHRNGWCYE